MAIATYSTDDPRRASRYLRPASVRAHDGRRVDGENFVPRNPRTMIRLWFLFFPPGWFGFITTSTLNRQRMSWLYRRLVRPVLFEQESEAIHDWTLQKLAWISRYPLLREVVTSFFEPPELPVELFGLSFANPVGVAAGLDKFAVALPAWAALGFGFCELGGVTWHPQPGNPRPRLFRAVADEALVNCMGFNNPGAEAMAKKRGQTRMALSLGRDNCGAVLSSSGCGERFP